MGRIALVLTVVAVVLAVAGWDETKLAGVVNPTPTNLKLADLKTTGAADGNRHVTISDFSYTPGYVYVTKRASWESVWMPVTIPGQSRPVAIIKSTRLRSSSEVDSFTANTSSLTGILTNDIGSLSTDQKAELNKQHPGVDFASLPVIEERKSVPSKSFGYTLYGVSALLLIFGGVLGFLAWKKSRQEMPRKRRKRDDDEFEEDEAPRRARGRRDEEEEEEPRRRRRNDDDEYDDDRERPRRRRRN